MVKKTNLYQCTSCEYQAAKWLGHCPTCKEWNSFELTNSIISNKSNFNKTTELFKLDSIKIKPINRIISGIKEWDRVTGGGIVPGSFIIVTGDPGIGKSTLLLQIAHYISQAYKVFYFSSEESLEQVKLRAERVGCDKSSVLFSDNANLDMIIETTKAERPDLIIIDSIQNCYLEEVTAAPGTINQLRESAFKLMRLSKENNIAIIITGHINKEGVIAGPKTLEHIVDGVFYLQGEDRWQARVLRSVKNRFGTIDELGFFHMNHAGLQEVPNINQQLLQSISYSPGSALISFIEGSRPLLIELQALVIPSKFGIAQRVVSGLDQTQIVLIAAILEKYIGIKLSSHDIFFKISGSFKIKTSGADLGIALALLSSYFQKPLPDKSLVLGEISLTGHIKPINQANLHINEADQFGISQFLLSKNQKIENNFNSLKFSHILDLLPLFD